MTFEGFEAAMLIETTGFSPYLLAQPDSVPSNAAGTLEAALQQIGRSHDADPGARSDILLDRAALRAEAGVLDLWTHERGGTNVQALRGPGQGLWADTSWRAWALDIGEDAPAPAGHAGKGSAPLSANLDKPPPKPDPDEEDNEVVVKGTRPKTYDEGGLDGIPGGEPGGAQPGGPGGSASSAQKVADHTQDCGSSDGAAVQVAKHVMGTPPGAGPPNPMSTPGGLNWMQAEFGAVIARGADGRYGALNDAIYSNEAYNYVLLPISGGANIEGLWHSHTTSPDPNQQLIDRYPSTYADGRSDWTMLQDLKDHVAPNDPNYDPSMWITGPDGVTREFKLSDREYYESLTDEQMRADVGLQGKERNQSCG